MLFDRGCGGSLEKLRLLLSILKPIIPNIQASDAVWHDEVDVQGEDIIDDAGEGPAQQVHRPGLDLLPLPAAAAADQDGRLHAHIHEHGCQEAYGIHVPHSGKQIC